MPLIKSGSKKAVSSNIEAEMAAGKPQKQAVAIALSTARRYAKRWMGGRTGYEAGGTVADYLYGRDAAHAKAGLSNAPPQPGMVQRASLDNPMAFHQSEMAKAEAARDAANRFRALNMPDLPHRAAGGLAASRGWPIPPTQVPFIKPTNTPVFNPMDPNAIKDLASQARAAKGYEAGGMPTLDDYGIVDPNGPPPEARALPHASSLGEMVGKVTGSLKAEGAMNNMVRGAETAHGLAHGIGDAAIGYTGYPMIDQGMRHAAEGVEYGNPLKTAAGFGEAGLAAVPFTKAGRAAFDSAKGLIGMGGAYLGLPWLAENAPTITNPAEAGDRGGSVLDILVGQREQLLRDRAKAQADADNQRAGKGVDAQGRPIKAGRGENYNAAQESLGRIDTNIKALDEQIKAEQARAIQESTTQGQINAARQKMDLEKEQARIAAEKEKTRRSDPEYVRAQREKDAAVKKREDAEWWGRPIREFLGPVGPALPLAGTAAAILLSRRNAAGFNERYNNAIKAFEEAAGKGDSVGMAMRQAALQNLEKGSWGSRTTTALAAGIPLESRLVESGLDLARGPETRAHKEALEQIKDPYSLGFGLGTGMLSSGVAYGIGQKYPGNDPADRAYGKAIAQGAWKDAGELASGYGDAVGAGKSLRKLQSEDRAEPTRPPIPLASSEPPPPSGGAGTALGGQERKSLPPPAEEGPFGAPPPAAAKPAESPTETKPSGGSPTGFPFSLPEGYTYNEAHRGSKIQGPDGRFTNMGPFKKIKERKDARSKKKDEDNGPDTERSMGGPISDSPLHRYVSDDHYAFGGDVLPPFAEPPRPSWEAHFSKHGDQVSYGMNPVPKPATPNYGAYAAYNPQNRAHGGPVSGPTGGRDDALPISVKSGSYVLPADVVSALGGGNTDAGMTKLTQKFGPSDTRDDGRTPMVPIKISDGEFIITPDQVAQLGGGDMAVGHKILDTFVLSTRKQHIETLKSLPPPAKG